MEMIERAALAAWIEYSVRPEDAFSEFDDDYTIAAATRDWNESPKLCTHIGADGFRDCARAAIKAIREPSEAMMEAAFKLMFATSDTPSIAAQWRAMIDVALSDAK